MQAAYFVASDERVYSVCDLQVNMSHCFLLVVKETKRGREGS